MTDEGFALHDFQVRSELLTETETKDSLIIAQIHIHRDEDDMTFG